MACIVAPSTGLDLTSFLAAVKKQLPSYATPIFLRLVMTLVWVQFVLVFAQPTQCSSVCRLRLPNNLKRQHVTEPKPMSLPLNHLPQVQQLDLTGTFKLKKIVMQQEGYNPNVIQDQMFFLDAVKGAYRQLDKCLYNDIIEMRCRL